MSKFIDKLKSVSSGEMPPMGFRTAGAKPRPRMLLVAHLAEAAKPAIAGADAVLLSIAKAGVKSPKTLVKSDTPWGGWLAEVTGPGVKRLGEGGADFVVFPAASAAQAVLAEEKLGKIVEVDPGLEAGLLRAVDDLPIDAVFLASPELSLSWERLMLIRRSVNLVGKPLMVAVSPDTTSSELQALCDAGVAGVVVESAGLGGLRQAIDKLVPPKAKHRKIQALVPRTSGASEKVSEEVEEEEDED